MKYFLITFVALYGFDIIGRLIWLGTGDFPERNAQTEAFSLFVNALFLVWGAILLARVL